MGLSGRRRAKKPTQSKTSITTAPEEAEPGEAFMDHFHHRPSHQHHGSGNTHRRVGSKAAREMKRSGFVSVDIERRGSSALLPDKPSRRTNPMASTAARPNANVCNKNLVRIMEDNFDSRLAYSLNKKSRWDFEASLADQYSSASQWQLREQNLLVFASEWSPRSRSGRATCRMATNTGPDGRADNEMSQSGHKLSVTRGARLNRASMRHSLDLPAASQADAADVRATVCVDVLTPRKRWGAVVDDATATAVERRDCHKGRRATKQRRRVRCLEPMAEAAQDRGEAFDWDEDVEEITEMEEPCVRSRCSITVFEVMQLNQGKGNRLVGSVKEERRPAMGRKGAGATPDSALSIDSADDDDDKDVVEAAWKASERLTKAVGTVLRQERPTIRVSSSAVAADRLKHLFAGTEALCLGGCQPRRLAVLLQPDITESVAFEEVQGDIDGDFVTLAVRHNFSGPNPRARRTSVQEIVAASATTDPFVFLRPLVVTPMSTVTPSPLLEGRSSSEATAAGWCRSVVLDEADARRRAVRALPMFAAAPSNPTSATDADADLECAICCSQPLTATEYDVIFAERSTALDGCGHRFCNSCWVRHVTACVGSGRVRVGCPGHGCPAVVDAAALLCLCPAWLLPALAAAAFRDWLAALRPSPQGCPNQRCGRLLVAAAGDSGNAGWNVACPACWSCLCLLCGQEPHWPSDCATADRYRRETVARGHAKLYRMDLLASVDVRAKQCPTCLLLMEKGAGCNHMSCPCGESFCWHCGRPLREHQYGGPCSNRKAIRAQSSYRVKTVLSASDILLVPNSSQSRLYCVAMRTRLMRRMEPSQLRVQQAQVRVLLSTAAAGLPGSCPEAVVGADGVVKATIGASYLVEYACARLDAVRRVGRSSSAAAVAASERILELVESIGEVTRRRRRLAAVAAVDAQLACQRLVDMRRELAIECRRLRRIVASVSRRIAEE